MVDFNETLFLSVVILRARSMLSKIDARIIMVTPTIFLIFLMHIYVFAHYLQNSFAMP